MPSLVNDRIVSAVQERCPLICKVRRLRMKNCVFVQKSHGSNVLSKTDSIIYPVFFPQFSSFYPPLGFSGSLPISSPLPRPILGSLETGGRVVISDFGRWSWLIDSTSDRMCVTSLFPGCSSSATCSDEQELWMHCTRPMFMYCASVFDTKNVFMPMLSVFLYKPHVVLSLAIWIITGLFDVFLWETKLCLPVQSHLAKNNTLYG